MEQLRPLKLNKPPRHNSYNLENYICKSRFSLVLANHHQVNQLFLKHISPIVIYESFWVFLVKNFALVLLCWLSPFLIRVMLIALSGTKYFYYYILHLNCRLQLMILVNVVFLSPDVCKNHWCAISVKFQILKKLCCFIVNR